MTRIDYAACAINALNAGFTTKSGKKEAISDATRAFDKQAGAIRNILLADRTIGGDNWSELYYYVPAMHNWKAKHDEAYAFAGDEILQTIRDLIELRAAIKDAPIAAVAPREVSKYEIATTKTLADLIELRKTQYLRAIDLGTIFNGLPVSANTHLVTNQYGHTFLRTFYFLAGVMTPLNVIIAAAEELERRKKAA
jgi:hypothetical protein